MWRRCSAAVSGAERDERQPCHDHPRARPPSAPPQPPEPGPGLAIRFSARQARHSNIRPALSSVTTAYRRLPGRAIRPSRPSVRRDPRRTLKSTGPGHPSPRRRTGRFHHHAGPNGSALADFTTNGWSIIFTAALGFASASGCPPAPPTGSPRSACACSTGSSSPSCSSSSACSPRTRRRHRTCP